MSYICTNISIILFQGTKWWIFVCRLPIPMIPVLNISESIDWTYNASKTELVCEIYYHLDLSNIIFSRWGYLSNQYQLLDLFSSPRLYSFYWHSVWFFYLSLCLHGRLFCCSIYYNFNHKTKRLIQYLNPVISNS